MLRDLEPLIQKGLCAAIYTQLTDIEEETNGLLTYDRPCMQNICPHCRTDPEETVMKLNYRRTFSLALPFYPSRAFWQLYDNIIPLILQNSFHLNETLIGAIMALDNVLAVFLLPFFGVLSDRCKSPLGKRTRLYHSGNDCCGDLYDPAAGS